MKKVTNLEVPTGGEILFWLCGIIRFFKLKLKLF